MGGRFMRGRGSKPMHWAELSMLKRRLLEEEESGPLSEVQGYIIDSCLNRGDRDKARQMIRDWNAQRLKLSRPKLHVSKWVPGDHYYALSKKFNTLEAAIQHLEENGYQFDGLRQRFQYRENGG